MTRRVVPIDIDFAGWTEVEAGQHNAWGIVDAPPDELAHKSGTLLGWHNMKSVADRGLRELLQ